MNCRLTLPLLNGYVDGELPAADLQRVSDHLAECPACAQQVSDLQTLQAALTSKAMYHHAPGTLHARVAQALVAAPATSLFTQPITLKSLAAVAASVVTLASIVWLGAAWLNQPGPSLADLTLSSHHQAVACNAQTQVNSSDPQVVQRWFVGKNSLRVLVRDLSAHKFTLVGARVEKGESCNIPVLVYSSHGKTVSLYHYPAQSDKNRRPCAIASPEYQLSNWSDKQAAYWAVSDMTQEQLAEFVNVMKSITGSRK
ncbi:MAG: zf-HC2 domain-containing protein [Gemmatales bacterium]